MTDNTEDMIREYESIIEELEYEINALRGKVPFFFKK